MVRWNMKQASRFRPKQKDQAPDLIQKTFQTALALHQQGKSGKARRLYENILKTQPDHVGALHLLGVLLFHEKKPDEAASLFARALSIKSDFAPLHSSYGVALQELKRLEEALASYDKAIAINPDDAEACFNRGNALAEMHRFDDAIASYQCAVAIAPDFAQAWSNHGDALQKRMRFEEALASYDKALAIKPDYAAAYSNQALALHELKRFDDALKSYDKALLINSDLYETHYNRGNLLRDLKLFDEALASYDQAVTINPFYAESFSNRGDCLHELRRFEDAIASYDRATEIKPDYAEAHSNCGVSLKEANRLAEAMVRYDEAIRIRSDHAEAHWNKALALLLNGDLPAGFRLYEWRKQKKSPVANRCFNAPVWSGLTELTNKKILVHEEQGVGDVIQFSRYIDLLRVEGARVVFAVSDKLANLMRTLHRDIEVCSIDRMPANLEFDFHCPLLSLPLAFLTDLHTIPAQTPYLYADQNYVASFRKQFLKTGDKKICGLSWLSNNDETGSVRSVTMMDLFRVIDATGWTFVNLQYGDVSGEIEDLRLSMGVEIMSPPEIDLYADMDRFAALVDSCDIVLTIDNTTAHMAGALNKKTLLMLPQVPDWRWMLGRADSPWYPSLRLFRQASRGDWDGVFQAVKAALAEALQS